MEQNLEETVNIPRVLLCDSMRMESRNRDEKFPCEWNQAIKLPLPFLPDIQQLYAGNSP